MPTSPEYDAILARKIREREEGNKGELPKNWDKALIYDAALKEPIKKKRGRPPGSKNRPKDAEP